MINNTHMLIELSEETDILIKFIYQVVIKY